MIPDTYVLTNRESLEKLLKDKKLITKAIMNGPDIKSLEGNLYLGYTSIVEEPPDELEAYSLLHYFKI